MLEIGIIGLPNVGKSSLFNALTKSAAASAQNFPFTTIEPNIGIVNVPDERLDFLASIFKSKSVVPTAIKFVDIAGLVKGASKGEGLGNQFLGNIRSVDAIVHVVRCFKSSTVIHVDGRVEPESDIATINTELILSDIEQLSKAKIRLGDRVKRRDAEAQKLCVEIDRGLELLNSGQSLRVDSELSNKLAEFGLLTSKPIIYVANVDEVDELTLKPIRAIAENEGARLIAVSVAVEAEIVNLPEQEQESFRKELNLFWGLNDLISASYELLQLQTFFTAGEKESRAWTITKGTKAPQAAGKIHSDFERGFIRAEVYSVADLHSYGTAVALREAGKLRSEGREYVVRDGDVIEFLFNV